VLYREGYVAAVPEEISADDRARLQQQRAELESKLAPLFTQLPRSFGQFRSRSPLSPLFVMRRFMFSRIVTKIRAISVDEYVVKCDH
jgi:uncharacterized protein YecE (DUF72 family)